MLQDTLEEIELAPVPKSSSLSPPSYSPTQFLRTQSLIWSLLIVSVVFAIIFITIAAVIASALNHLGNGERILQDSPPPASTSSPNPAPSPQPTLPSLLGKWVMPLQYEFVTLKTPYGFANWTAVATLEIFPNYYWMFSFIVSDISCYCGERPSLLRVNCGPGSACPKASPQIYTNLIAFGEWLGYVPSLAADGSEYGTIRIMPATRGTNFNCTRSMNNAVTGTWVTVVECPLYHTPASYALYTRQGRRYLLFDSMTFVGLYQSYPSLVVTSPNSFVEELQ